MSKVLGAALIALVGPTSLLRREVVASVVAMVVLVGLSTPSAAAQMTAGDLMVSCALASPSCEAYIQGFMDGVIGGVGAAKDAFICPPDYLTTEEVRSTFLRAMKRRPVMRGLAASSAMAAALADRFPCPKHKY